MLLLTERQEKKALTIRIFLLALMIFSTYLIVVICIFF